MQSGGLQGVKNIGKSFTVRPRKWPWSLTGGGCLPEVPTAGFDWENFGVLEWWSLMLGACTWKFDCNRKLESAPIEATRQPMIQNTQFLGHHALRESCPVATYVIKGKAAPLSSTVYPLSYIKPTGEWILNIPNGGNDSTARIIFTFISTPLLVFWSPKTLKVQKILT